jgi:small conductance mechanosensitive channel
MPVDEIEVAEVLQSVAVTTPKLISAVLIFLFFVLMARLLRGLVKRFGRTRRLSADLVNLLVQITETALLIFGGVSALGTLGIDVTAMIAGLGLVGFALGFALRDLLSNFLSGLLILVYNPFVRGDHISIGVNEGDVVEINMRYTVLQNGGKRILIPNANLFSMAVIVEAREGERLPGDDAGLS